MSVIGSCRFDYPGGDLRDGCHRYEGNHLQSNHEPLHRETGSIGRGHIAERCANLQVYVHHEVTDRNPHRDLDVSGNPVLDAVLEGRKDAKPKALEYPKNAQERGKWDEHLAKKAQQFSF